MTVGLLWATAARELPGARVASRRLSGARGRAPHARRVWKEWGPPAGRLAIPAPEFSHLWALCAPARPWIPPSPASFYTTRSH